MKNTDRITAMEARLNSAEAALRELLRALDAFDALQSDIDELSRYLGSEEWFSDCEAWDRGELPKGLRCGVLSQDSIYDLLSERRELAESMRGAADKILGQR